MVNDNDSVQYTSIIFYMIISITKERWSIKMDRFISNACNNNDIEYTVSKSFKRSFKVKLKIMKKSCSLNRKNRILNKKTICH